MTPENLLNADNLPPDLQWVAEHYRLHPDDPVYLLIAWYWHRVKSSEDTLQAAIVEMKAALDARIDLMSETADSIAGVTTGLTQIQQEMAHRPAILGQELETQLRQPVTEAVARLQQIEKSLGPVARRFRMAQRHHFLAVLLIGVALGVIAAEVLFHA